MEWLTHSLKTARNYGLSFNSVHAIVTPENGAGLCRCKACDDGPPVFLERV